MKIKVVQQNKESVLEKLRAGRLDSVHASKTSFEEEMLLDMHKNGILPLLGEVIPDKRQDNITKPFDLILTLFISAKLKGKHALSFVPFAIRDHRLLSVLGYNIEFNEDIEKGIMDEKQLRHLFGMYEWDEFIGYYNELIQNHIIPKMDISGTTHILDCTVLEVNKENDKYEDAEIGKKSDGEWARGYKMATLRRIVGTTGIIEEIEFGGIKESDIILSENIILNSPMFNPGDNLINDRGYINRDNMNHLKNNREVNIYMPLKRSMIAFKKAVEIAKTNNKWSRHPNKSRDHQMVASVPNLGAYWKSDNPENDVNFNTCVVWDLKADKAENEYRVFISTDLTKTAKEIVLTYEYRTEIEEDYRQLKDKEFWNIQDFRTKKLNLIVFHVITTLIGYLFFLLYTMFSEGEQYKNKNFQNIKSRYESKNLKYYIYYVDDEFGVLTFLESLKLYASVTEYIRNLLDPILETA